MVWCGVVWCGVVWWGMVWYGMVWYGMVVNMTVLCCFLLLVLMSQFL